MKTIRKAIIPAAGFGTRFLPATKSVPKEMLPIVDKPTIQYIVEEIVACGITDILIITNQHKNCIENHFDYSFELSAKLLESNDLANLKIIQDIAELANIHIVHQKNPKGLGHAVLCAETFVNDEPFCVLLGDDIVTCEGLNATQQCINAYNKNHGNIVGVQHIDKTKIHKYGVIDCKTTISDNTYEINGLVEKPNSNEAPSDLAVMGRYVLEPSIFSYLKTQAPGKGNEIQLTDALNRSAKDSPAYALAFEGKRYDVGDKIGFLQAQLEFALARPELATEVKQMISNIKEK